MKSVLCAIVKNENRYLSDWVDYHYKLGFDKIVICDNNDTETIHQDGVDIINYRRTYIPINNKKTTMLFNSGIQEKAYNDCYNKYSKEYDWIAFFDIDEYLILDNGLKINEFLSQERFNNVDAIQINWLVYNDNDKLIFEDIPVMQRFTTCVEQNCEFVKSIVRTKNPNFISLVVHYAKIKNGKYVYPNGDVTEPGLTQVPNYKGAHINHYYTKTIDEWVDRKCGTTEVIGRKNSSSQRINEFFEFNVPTIEKIQIIEQKLNCKLKQYRPNKYIIHK